MQSYLLFAVDRSEREVVWWAPDERGYTANLEKAGRYSIERASQLESARHEGEETIAVPMSVARAGAEAVRTFVAERILILRRQLSA